MKKLQVFAFLEIKSEFPEYIFNSVIKIPQNPPTYIYIWELKQITGKYHPHILISGSILFMEFLLFYLLGKLITSGNKINLYMKCD